MRCRSQPQPQAFQKYQGSVLKTTSVVNSIYFSRGLFLLFLVCCLLFGCSACQRFLCTWEVPVPIGLAWPVPNHTGMLGHLFSFGTGTAACEAIVEDCPHHCRLRPLLGAKKGCPLLPQRVGEQGDVEGMRPVGLSLAQALPQQGGKGTLWGELRSWGSSHLWLHESIK